MKKFLVILAALVVLVCGLAPQPPQSEGRSASSNLERIVRDAAPAVRAQKKIEAEFAKREQELEKMAEQLKRMQDAAGEERRDACRRPSAATRSASSTTSTAISSASSASSAKTSTSGATRNCRSVIERANRIISQIAEQEKYDIIFQEAVYASPRIDITDKVIKALEDKPAGK